MSIGVMFSVCSSIFNLLLIIIYSSKKRVNNIETKIYTIIWTTFIGSLDSLPCYFGTLYNEAFPILGLIFSKLYLVFVHTYMCLIMYYYLAISNHDSTEKSLRKTENILLIYYLLILAAIFILPIYYNAVEYEVYTYGPAVNLNFAMATVCIFVVGFCIVKEYKRYKIDKSSVQYKKYIPIIFCIIFVSIAVILQKLNPSWLFITTALSLVTHVMFHTIENPDVKMIEQLNIAREQADRANNAKSEFLSSMSHEIRTPLNAIVGFSQALAEEDLSPQAEDEVKDIMMASETLLELVNGILDISKIEANKLEIVGVEYKIQDMLDELVSLTRARLGEKPLDFRVNIADDLPKYLYGDKVRVKQVILNLLTNSVKYTKEGWFSFNVNCIKRKDMCRLLISVEDSGIGIKPESIDKLFSKFERLDIEKNNTIEGTGLGLAITKKLVDLMGGKIVVQSIYGKGSKFTLAIDQRIVENPTDTSLELTQTLDVEKIKALDLTGKRILVVDDNKINLKVATRLLSDYKCIIETFDNGFSCIEKFEVGAHYDLILMDDMMPKMSGVETFHKLKEIEGFNTPVVALTANAISGMREKYLAEGFDDYLSKPIDKKELQKVLVKFLVEDKNA